MPAAEGLPDNPTSVRSARLWDKIRPRLCLSPSVQAPGDMQLANGHVDAGPASSAAKVRPAQHAARDCPAQVPLLQPQASLLVNPALNGVQIR